jgi:hypothetical protein
MFHVTISYSRNVAKPTPLQAMKLRIDTALRYFRNWIFNGLRLKRFEPRGASHLGSRVVLTTVSFHFHNHDTFPKENCKSWTKQYPLVNRSSPRPPLLNGWVSRLGLFVFGRSVRKFLPLKLDASGGFAKVTFGTGCEIPKLPKPGINYPIVPP